MSFDLNEIAKLKALAANASAFGTDSLASSATNIIQNEIEKATNNSAVMAYEKWKKEDETSRQLYSQYLDNSTIAALHKNHDNSMQLESAIAKLAGTSPAYEEFITNKKILDEHKVEVQSADIPHLHIQKNPILETNKKLDKVQKNIEDLQPMAIQAAQLINSLNEVAVKMQVESAINSANTRKQTKIALWISVLSIVISSLFSIKNSIDSNIASDKNDAQLKSFQSEIRSITTIQADGNTALVKAINDVANKSVKLDKK